VDAQKLRALLLRRKIATMPELKEALGTDVDLTVFRKLRELSYHTSYSQRGKYYTLDELVRFDAVGLWSFRSVWFSQHGTLVRTCEALVSESEAGYFADELEAVLHVEVKDALRKLAGENRITREKLEGRFLHLSADAPTARQQLRARKVRLSQPGELVSFGAGTRVLPDELKAAIILFYALLDEKQRRLYAGLESLKLGHGGDQRIAELLGLDPGTVGKGRRELIAREVSPERVRKKGAGRKSSEKNPPT
jgi:hypothetical protein